MSMGTVLHVNEEDFEREVLEASRTQPVLVDFYADWCGPCRALAPVGEELAQELHGRLKVVKLDVDRNDALASKHNVHSIPTLIVFKDGREVERLIGYMPKAQLRQALEKHLS